MGAISPTITDVSAKGDGSAMQAVWSTVTESDTCNPIKFPKHADKSVQVLGTFGGASVTVQGSNDGTNYATLNDLSSVPIAITSAGIKGVLENTVLVKPVATGGSSQSLTIAMLVTYQNPART